MKKQIPLLIFIFLVNTALNAQNLTKSDSLMKAFEYMSKGDEKIKVNNEINSFFPIAP